MVYVRYDTNVYIQMYAGVSYMLTTKIQSDGTWRFYLIHPTQKIIIFVSSESSVIVMCTAVNDKLSLRENGSEWVRWYLYLYRTQKRFFFRVYYSPSSVSHYIKFIYKM